MSTYKKMVEKINSLEKNNSVQIVCFSKMYEESVLEISVNGNEVYVEDGFLHVNSLATIKLPIENIENIDEDEGSFTFSSLGDMKVIIII